MTDAQLLEADQQLPEPIQPGEGALDHPPPGAALRRASAGGGVASLGEWGRYRRWSIALQAGCPV